MLNKSKNEASNQFIEQIMCDGGGNDDISVGDEEEEDYQGRSLSGVGEER